MRKKIAIFQILISCYCIKSLAYFEIVFKNTSKFEIFLDYKITHSRVNTEYFNQLEKIRIGSNKSETSYLPMVSVEYRPDDRAQLVIVGCKITREDLVDGKTTPIINHHLSSVLTMLPSPLLGLISDYAATPNCINISFPVSFDLDTVLNLPTLELRYFNVHITDNGILFSGIKEGFNENELPKNSPQKRHKEGFFYKLFKCFGC